MLILIVFCDTLNYIQLWGEKKGTSAILIRRLRQAYQLFDEMSVSLGLDSWYAYNYLLCTIN